jgi:hypothetical protein
MHKLFEKKKELEEQGFTISQANQKLPWVK